MIRKRGNTYHFEFMLDRQRYFGALNGSDGNPIPASKAQAREMEVAIRAQVRAGTYKQQHSADLERFATFFDRVFLPYSKAHKRSWKHDEFRGSVLKEHFGDRAFAEITPMLVVSFINARLASTTKRNRTRSPVTVHKELTLLSSVFSCGIGEGVCTINPCLSLPKSVRRRLPSRNKRERFLSIDEEDRLLANLTGRRSHLWPVVVFALETGLRKGELSRLEVEHVNLSDHVRVTVVEGKRVEITPGEIIVGRGKNGRSRVVPMSARARAVAVSQVNDVTTGRFLFTSYRTQGAVAEIKRAFTAAVRDAGIEDFRFHDLRHTFASRLNAAGANVFAIRDLLGHSTASMSSDYTHTSSSDRREAIEMLDQQHSTSASNYGKIPAKGVRLAG